MTIYKHQLCKAVETCQPNNGKTITDGTLLRVLDVFGDKVELMDQRGHRYVVDYSTDGHKFLIIDEMHFGTAGYIFISEDEEPAAEGSNFNIMDFEEGDYYYPSRSFCAKVKSLDEDVDGDVVEVKSGTDILVYHVGSTAIEFDCNGDFIFVMTIGDINRIGLFCSVDREEKENERKKDSDYVLYLKAFIHVKSGGVFDMLDTDYTEHELRVIATAVVDAKNNKFKSKKNFRMIDYDM